jgi:hypothetical protein
MLPAFYKPFPDMENGDDVPFHHKGVEHLDRRAMGDLLTGSMKWISENAAISGEPFPILARMQPVRWICEARLTDGNPSSEDFSYLRSAFERSAGA